ncbi:MAG: hypothetical protein Q4C47_10050 [Planctomycetia bacterium]|nr:hypothetical protein [Planctomycetia bacterium]
MEPERRIRVIVDPEPRSGSENLAIDTMLLTAAAPPAEATETLAKSGEEDRKTTESETAGIEKYRKEASTEIPVLRFYRWRPTLSLGHFQSPESIPEAFAHQNGLDVVRRPSGGGAIVHHHEWTYALVLPPTVYRKLRSGTERDPGTERPGAKTVMEIGISSPVAIVRRLHLATAAVLREMFGVDARLAEAVTEREWEPPDLSKWSDRTVAMGGALDTSSGKDVSAEDERSATSDQTVATTGTIPVVRGREIISTTPGNPGYSTTEFLCFRRRAAEDVVIVTSHRAETIPEHHTPKWTSEKSVARTYELSPRNDEMERTESPEGTEGPGSVITSEYERGSGGECVPDIAKYSGCAKVLGSAMRMRRGAVLIHGSFLMRRSPYAPSLPGVLDLLPESIVVSAAVEQRLFERWKSAMIAAVCPSVTPELR